MPLVNWVSISFFCLENFLLCLLQITVGTVQHSQNNKVIVKTKTKPTLHQRWSCSVEVSDCSPRYWQKQAFFAVAEKKEKSQSYYPWKEEPKEDWKVQKETHPTEEVSSETSEEKSGVGDGVDDISTVFLFLFNEHLDQRQLWYLPSIFPERPSRQPWPNPKCLGVLAVCHPSWKHLIW